MLFRLFCGAAALFLPLAAHAAPCSMPAALQRVCDDPALARIEAQLVAKEHSVQAASSRPATWAARAAEFRAYTATENDDDGKQLSNRQLGDRLREQIRDLDRELARAATIKAPADQAAVLGETCLATWLVHGCEVSAAGVLRSGEVRIAWQLQEGASDSDGGGMGVMLWDVSKPGAPVPIGWTFEGVYMHAPQYNAKLGLLWVPGIRGGTGDGNADILYQKQGDHWVEIETVSWRSDLDKRLPKGFGAWHGIDYDFMGLGGQTQLWRDADANCCATGGRAYLDFSIAGTSIKLDGIQADIAKGWEPSKKF